MTSPKRKLPENPEAELTPWVPQLLEIILRQHEPIDELQEQNRRLKGHQGKPPITPSRMDQEAQGEEASQERKRGPRRAKTAQLKAVDEVSAPQGLAADAREQGWRFKGYADSVGQTRVIEARNLRYRLEEWQGPQGQWRRGKLPPSGNGHVGPERVSYVRHQSPHQPVTQPLVWEQWHAFGVALSAGQLNPLLRHEQERFHQEKAPVLEAGLQVSQYLQPDDTGARHDGKHGYGTDIGNEFFAWLESPESQSRVNVLSRLRAGHQDSVLNAGALESMAPHQRPQVKLTLLPEGRSFEDKHAWEG